MSALRFGGPGPARAGVLAEVGVLLVPPLAAPQDGDAGNCVAISATVRAGVLCRGTPAFQSGRGGLSAAPVSRSRLIGHTVQPGRGGGHAGMGDRAPQLIWCPRGT